MIGHQLKRQRRRPQILARNTHGEIDEESKALLASATELRKVSDSDCVPSIVVGQPRRELAAAEGQTISLTPEEQLDFWEALSKPPKLQKHRSNTAKPDIKILFVFGVCAHLFAILASDDPLNPLRHQALPGVRESIHAVHIDLLKIAVAIEWAGDKACVSNP